MRLQGLMRKAWDFHARNDVAEVEFAKKNFRGRQISTLAQPPILSQLKQEDLVSFFWRRKLTGYAQRSYFCCFFQGN